MAALREGEDIKPEPRMSGLLVSCSYSARRVLVSLSSLTLLSILFEFIYLGELCRGQPQVRA